MTVTESLFAEAGRRQVVVGQEALDIGQKCGHAHLDKCEISHRQGVKLHACSIPGSTWDKSHMGTKLDIVSLRKQLQAEMDRVGIKAKPLSIAAGLGETSVRDILDGRVNDPRVGTLARLADYLDVPVSRFIGDDDVAVVGRIGAGGSIAYLEVESDETVPRPPQIAGQLEALEVVGDSMLPRYSSGDIVYISRQQDGVRPEYFGEYCAVRLTSGETFLKLLARGSRPGFVTLRSLNAADMEDVEVDWATPIISVLPRFARSLIGR